MRSILLLPGLGIVLALGGCQPSSPAPDAATDAIPAPSTAATAPTSSVPVPKEPAPAGPAPVAASSADHWQCGEVLLDARLDADAIHLDFSGRALALPHVESLMGARYADAEGNSFMRQGADAILILAGDDSRDCTRSDRVSPWIEAAARGIAFRAVGNEPGWFVEVGQGEAPSLQATLDYGDRALSVTGLQPAALGFTGKTAGGVTVVLEIQRTRCQDGMSGETFEATVRLVVGTTTYRGCGAFLAD